MTLHALDTPALLVEHDRFDRNIARMRDQLARFPDVAFRPHVKTVKSIAPARAMTHGPITVSTLKEAEQFADAGFDDILYAVGLAPDKLSRVAALAQCGVAMTVILDSIAMAQACAAFAAMADTQMEVLIEVDTDGHRGGVRPDDPELIEIAAILSARNLLKGVMTHCGGSYAARGAEQIRSFARQEREGVVAAADRLRAAGFACPVVSMGSTPTASFADRLDGVSEVRAGVYAFQDLVMAGIGVCDVDDIALSVLATVIGHQADRGHAIVDAGWMAMSRDRGTQAQPIDQGYGLVTDLRLAPVADAIMIAANQEHGVIAPRDGGRLDLSAFPIGRRLRILPNHACATAAQHHEYVVIDGNEIVARWPRFAGW